MYTEKAQGQKWIPVTRQSSKWPERIKVEFDYYSYHIDLFGMYSIFDNSNAKINC